MKHFFKSIHSKVIEAAVDRSILGFLSIFVLFAMIGLVLAQLQIQLGLLIVNSFDANANIVTGETYDVGAVTYSNKNPISMNFTSNADVEYIVSGDIVGVQTGDVFSGVVLQTGVLLSNGDGLKQFEVIFEQNSSGYIQTNKSELFEVFIDQTSPSGLSLIQPTDQVQTYGSQLFERSIANDTGIGLRDYTFLISNDSGFAHIVFVDSVDSNFLTYNINALGNGEYFWKVVANDKLGNSISSEFRSFVVNIPETVDQHNGGGGSDGHWPTIYDYCPLGDFSDSYYDGQCSASEWVQNNGEEELGHFSADETNLPPGVDQEAYLAFQFASDYGISNSSSLYEDDVFSPLLRKEAAKIFVQFAINVVGLEPTVNTGCGFDDIDKESPELQYFMITACELGLMGVTTYGEPDISFNPNELFRRTHFVTVLSRLLRGNKYNGGEIWYAKHLSALSRADVVHIVDSPWLPELRIFTYIMLLRTDNYGYVQHDADRSPLVSW